MSLTIAEALQEQRLTAKVVEATPEDLAIWATYCQKLALWERATREEERTRREYHAAKAAVKMVPV